MINSMLITTIFSDKSNRKRSKDKNMNQALKSSILSKQKKNKINKIPYEPL